LPFERLREEFHEAVREYPVAVEFVYERFSGGFFSPHHLNEVTTADKTAMAESVLQPLLKLFNQFLSGLFSVVQRNLLTSIVTILTEQSSPG
jgi:hypothetical protein